jgi:hypothetical protein
MFDTNHSIPPGLEIHLSKLEGGLINTNTCNGARLLGQLLVDAVDHAVQEKRELTGEIADNLLNGIHSAMVQDCNNHMRNVWINAVTITLSVYLNKVLADDLGKIDHRLRFSTMFDAIPRTLDKAVRLPANYPKGFGDMFRHWLLKYHLGALLVPVQRTAGSRQDLATEGAGAVYWNRILGRMFALRQWQHLVGESVRCIDVRWNGCSLSDYGYHSLQNLYASEMACWKHAIHWTTRIWLVNEINGEGDWCFLEGHGQHRIWRFSDFERTIHECHLW